MPLLVAIVRSMRPAHWTKNLLVFAGWVFSMDERSFELSTELGYLLEVLVAFAAFCLIASSIYIFNDIADRKRDALHPVKKHRPIASGALPVPVALASGTAMLLAALLLGFSQGYRLGLIIAVYWVLFMLYSHILKHKPIVDVTMISLGLILRAVSGAVAMDVRVSAWLIICTFSLALFIGFGKRYAELKSMKKHATKSRAVLNKYSLATLQIFFSICGAVAIVAYLLYAAADTTTARVGMDMVLTVPLVIYGLLRFLLLVIESGRGEDPVLLLLKDWPMLITVLTWGILSAWLLSAHPNVLQHILY